jgi:hypothetical protein
MANPKEKIFLLYLGMLGGPEFENLRKYIEENMTKGSITEPTKYLHWLRASGERMYIIGSMENTIWTPDRIIAKIQKNVPNAHTLFCVEIQDRPCQGLMGNDFWKFIKDIQDLTKTVSDSRRSTKLKKIKKLIDKKEELKRKGAELANREAEISRKREILNEEEELLRKEEEIRKQEEALNKKEVEIKKRKKFLGLF